MRWFAFWAREVLRWGTLDPFVAFCFAQSLAKTRQPAANRRAEFDAWLLTDGYCDDAESKIDPQLFLKWDDSLSNDFEDSFEELPDAAILVGTDGRKRRYPVIPVDTEGGVDWLDPAGFKLARTENDDANLDAHIKGETSNFWYESKTSWFLGFSLPINSPTGENANAVPHSSERSEWSRPY